MGTRGFLYTAMLIYLFVCVFFIWHGSHDCSGGIKVYNGHWTVISPVIDKILNLNQEK